MYEVTCCASLEVATVLGAARYVCCDWSPGPCHLVVVHKVTLSVPQIPGNQVDLGLSGIEVSRGGVRGISS